MPHITGTPSGYIPTDKKEIHLTFPDSDGEEHEMIFSPQKLESFITQAISLLGQIMSMESQGADVQIVQMINIKDFQISQMKAHNKIAIMLLGNGNIPYRFALDAKDGPRFRDDIIAALKI